MTRLLVGPVLRHVGTTDATVWVETDGPCEVRVLGARERTWTRERPPLRARHRRRARARHRPPRTRSASTASAVWPPPTRPVRPSRIRTLPPPDSDAAGRVRIAFGSCRYSRSVDDRVRPALRPRLARRVRPRTRAPGRGGLADGAAHARRPGLRRRDHRTDPPAHPREARHHARQQGPGRRLRGVHLALPRVLDRPRRPLADVHRPQLDDLRRPRRARRLEHLARRGGRRCRRPTGGRSASSAGCRRTGCTSTSATCRPPSSQPTRCTSRYVTHDGDVEHLLREFAAHADAEADGAKGTRWSFRRDFGRTRLVMIDSRCGRILAEGRRSMISEDEFALGRVAGRRHLRPPARRHVPAVAAHPGPARPRGVGRGPVRRVAPAAGRPLRRVAAPRGRPRALGRRSALSFERLAALLAWVAGGDDAPATVCVLSGDVHHAYVAEAHFDRPLRARVFQLTCSPLNNYVPWFMKLVFRAFWSRAAERFVRVLLRSVAPVPAGQPAVVAAGRAALRQRDLRVRRRRARGRSRPCSARRPGPGRTSCARSRASASPAEPVPRIPASSGAFRREWCEISRHSPLERATRRDVCTQDRFLAKIARAGRAPAGGMPMTTTGRLLALNALAAANTANAWHPVDRHGHLSMQSFLAGWPTSELAVPSLGGLAAANAVGAWRGGFRGRAGVLSAALAAGSATTLLAMERLARKASATSTPSALLEGLGTDYADRIMLPTFPGPDAALAGAPGLVRMARIRRRFALDADLPYGEHGRANHLDVWHRDDLPRDGKRAGAGADARRGLGHRQQAGPGVPADEPPGRARLGVRRHQLPPRPAQHLAGPDRRRQAGHRVGPRAHRRLRRRPVVHRRHRRFGRRPPEFAGRAHAEPGRVAARVRGRRHVGVGRRAVLRRLRLDRPRSPSATAGWCRCCSGGSSSRSCATPRRCSTRRHR